MKKLLSLLLVSGLMLGACSPESKDVNTISTNQGVAEVAEADAAQAGVIAKEPISDERVDATQVKKTNSSQGLLDGYRLLEVDGGDTSGYREANVVVNIGFGNREYWGFTNDHGQLVRVIADEIIIQDDATEDVNSDGRYYSRMADVPGVGADAGYDRGHVIADSLGGVANAYNITPQDAILNRHGDQAYMEKVIRDAGGATDFEAIITYPNTETQIPSHYKYTYTIRGNRVVDEFANLNPDKLNEELGLTGEKKEDTKQEKEKSSSPSDASSGNQYVDENGNGLIKGSNSGIYHTPNSSYYSRTKNVKQWFKSIEEAEAAGYRAPKR